MIDIPRLLAFVFLFFNLSVMAQSVTGTLEGKIIANDGSKERVLILNVTKESGVETDDAGYFSMKGDVGDTLRFISPFYMFYTYKISEADFSRDLVLFPLEKNKMGNVLEEIIITKRERTSSASHTYNTPGLSPVERKLSGATRGIFLTPLINYLTGETKMLKKALVYEREGFRVDKFLDYISVDKLVSDYNIPYDYAEAFAFYAVNDEEVKKALDIDPLDVKFLEGVISPVAKEFLEVISNHSN